MKVPRERRETTREVSLVERAHPGLAGLSEAMRLEGCW
jgi:hypothetical protein